MFSESDFEKLKNQALKEAKLTAEQKINKAKEKLLRQKEEFFKSLDLDREKELLKLKYEKILKEKELEINQRYELEFEKFYQNFIQNLKKSLLEKIRQNALVLCECFINKLSSYENGELFLPKFLKNRCQSRFKTTYTDSNCFVFKTGSKYIVFDPEESVNKTIQGELCLK